MHKNTNREGLNRLLALSKEELENLYTNNSHSEIAIQFGLSRYCIQNRFKHLGIDSRSNAESQTLCNRKRFGEFSYEQKQLVYGSLLGDACLHRQFTPSNKTGTYTAKYRLSFSHSVKQLPYLLHKKSVIGQGVKCKELKTSVKVSGHGSKMYGFCFQHTPTLIEVAKLCHNQNHKKVVSQKWLDNLEWLGIAYWYQDDGSLHISPNRRCISFYTNSYSRGEIDLLLQMLRRRFGLNASTRKGNNENERVIIANKSKEVDIFLENIEPHIIPEMKYKIRISGTIEDWKNANSYLL